MQDSSIESMRTVLANHRTSLRSVLACFRTTILTVKRTACAAFIGATAPNDETNQHVVSLVAIGYYNAVNRGRYEKIRDCDLCQFCDDRRCRSGSGVYDHPAARCSPD